VHLAVRFLGHDAEQQRLGQAVALERRRHQVPHVLVVLVALHQRDAHVGEPAADAGLHRGIELHHAHEALAVGGQQRRGIGAWRHRTGGQVAGLVRQRRVDVVAIAVTFADARIGIVLEQALVGGQQLSQRAALLLAAGGDDVLHVFERAVALRDTCGIVVADLDQRLAIFGFGGSHALVEQFCGGAVSLGLCGGRGRKRSEDQDGDERGQAAGK
jgi:hypothetical protein